MVGAYQRYLTAGCCSGSSVLSWNLPSRVVQLLATSFFLLVHLPSMRVLFLRLHRRPCLPSGPRLTEHLERDQLQSVAALAGPWTLINYRIMTPP
jgi:hypothetical protein